METEQNDIDNYKISHSWVSKLFTKEDPINLHKTLGLLCLVNFIYRYVYLQYKGVEFMGFVENRMVELNVLCVLLHMALSCSSIIFHVLKKRILKKPMVIWEEYRLHAIVFSSRACLISLYGFFRPAQGTAWENVHLFAIYLATSLVVDEITRRHGSKDYTTVRIDGNVSALSKMALTMYSFYQFSAVASHITPSASIACMGFNALIAIQSSAFLMTLYRKGLIEWYTHGAIYSACLVASWYCMWQAWPEPYFWLRVVVVFVLRTQFRFSKYTVWALFALVTVYPLSISRDMDVFSNFDTRIFSFGK